MKLKVYFWTFLLIVCMVGHAQNWQPVNAAYRYNYSIYNKSVLADATIKVDSVKAIGNDSVYFLNRIMVICDTCSSSYPFYVGGMYSNSPQFLGRRYMKKNNGDFVFSNDALDPDSYSYIDYVPDQIRNPMLGAFTIRPQAKLADSWLLDSLRSISATVCRISIDSVFNTVDSVKTIALSSKDTILLSRNHGLLRFLKHKLIGIEGAIEAGVKVPGYKEIYDFQVGDMFEYSHYYSYAGLKTSGSNLSKFTVMRRKDYPDSIVYTIKGVAFYTTTTSQDTQSKQAQINGNIVFTNHDPILDCYNNQQFSLSCNSYDISYNPVAIGMSPSFKGRISKGFGSDLEQSSFKPRQGQTNVFDAQRKTRNVKYVTGLGMVSSYIDCFEQYEQDTLVAYKKGSETMGTFTPDSLLMGIKRSTFPGKFSIYPNPASTLLRVSLLTNDKTMVRLLNIAGQVVLEKILSGEGTLDVSGLENGLYILKAQSGTVFVNKKIIVNK